MTELDESLEERFSRLTEATEGLVVRPGFHARVVGALSRPRQDGWAELYRWGRFGLAAGFVLAVASVATAVYGSYQSDQALAAAYGAVELLP